MILRRTELGLPKLITKHNTVWEINEVISNPSWFGKARFYLGGKLLKGRNLEKLLSNPTGIKPL